MANSKTKIPKIDLEEPLLIRVSGEAGKFNTISWDTLKKMGDALQDLVKTIAKNDVDTSEAILLDNFALELSGFNIGSAIPVFRFSSHIIPTINGANKQREVVSNRFSKLMYIADSGDYMKLKEEYKTEIVRSTIAEKLFNFVNSTGNSPVEIVKKRGKGYTSVSKIRKFKPQMLDLLIVNKKGIPKDSPIETIDGVASVKLTNKGGKKRTVISEVYTTKDTQVSFAPEILDLVDKQYILDFPLRSSIQKVGGHYIIECEMLGIVASGATEDEAEDSFSQEFDFIYRRYNELPNEKLSSRLNKIKTLINLLVKEVITK